MRPARRSTVARSTLAGQVYDLLLQQVLDGSLRPGQRLVEAEIATSVGTSRGPVREAIARLQRQGLVRSDPFVGASIVESDQRELAEIYSLRAVLEGYAASLLVQRRTRNEILELRAITDRMREARGSRLASQLRKLDAEFHAALVRLADDRQLLQVWERGRTRVALYLSTVEEAFHDAEAMARMHERFVDALLTGDPAEAEKQVRAHLMANGNEWTTKMRWPDTAGSQRRDGNGRGDGLTVTTR